MNKLRALPVILLLTTCGTAFSAAQNASPAELQQRADQASGAECARLSMQAARQALENAKRLFAGGDSKAAHEAIDVSLAYARRAVDCSVQAHKTEKATEIDLRHLIGRAKEVLQTLDTEDQPHLSQLLTELETQRDHLLQAIFGAAAADGEAEKKP